jgi:hypothetical protein
LLGRQLQQSKSQTFRENIHSFPTNSRASRTLSTDIIVENMATESSTVAATESSTAAASVPVTAAARKIGTNRRTSLVDLPNYFVETADLAMLRRCFLKRDDANPDQVTHLTAVPIDTVDASDPLHFIDIRKQISLGNLRKISVIFRKTRATTKDVAYAQIQDIANLEITVGALSNLAKGKTATDLLLIAKSLMRLVGVLFGPTCVHYFAEINNKKRVADFERGLGRNDENFYLQVSKAVNDNNNEQHLFLHPCGDPLDEEEYNKYINDETMAKGLHPSGKDVTLSIHPKWAKKVVKYLCQIRNRVSGMMHKSGNGDPNAMSFVHNAIKQSKINKAYLTDVVAYYFYMQCKYHQKIAAGINNTLPTFMSSCKYKQIVLWSFGSYI